MKRIHSPRELLEKHATAGDPVAFLALVRPQLEQAYARLHSGGVSSQACLATVLPPVRDGFRRFLRGAAKPSADVWLEARLAKCVPKETAETRDEVFIGNIDSSGIDGFQNEVQLALQRYQSAVRSGRVRGSAMGPAERWLLGRVLPFVLVFGLVMAGLYYLLDTFGWAVSVAVISPAHVITLSFPHGMSSMETAPSTLAAQKSPEPAPATNTPAAEQIPANVAPVQLPRNAALPKNSAGQFSGAAPGTSEEAAHARSGEHGSSAVSSPSLFAPPQGKPIRSSGSVESGTARPAAIVNDSWGLPSSEKTPRQVPSASAKTSSSSTSDRPIPSANATPQDGQTPQNYTSPKSGKSGGDGTDEGSGE